MPYAALRIDDADQRDIAAIAAIYNEVIATSTAVFSEQRVTLAERQAWLDDHRGRREPVLVARLSGEVVGFATYGRFRPWSGYESTVEHTVHVAAAQRRRGIGRALLTELIERARGDGRHMIVAGIDAENEPSLRLHEQLGFQRVGLLPQIARKFDRWVDLALLQREL